LATNDISATESNGAKLTGGRDALPTSERVYQSLREMIVRGELEPGARLVEVQVARELGVSRTPVREALKRLLAEGYISRAPLGGLVVHQASADEVDEAYPIREILDGLAARLAAHRATPEQMMRLHVIHNSLLVAANEQRTDDVVTTNVAFHETIYDIAGNQRLISLGRELGEFVRRFSHEAYVSGPERLAEVVREHEAILTALDERDPEEAEAAARRHLQEAHVYMARLRAAEELELARR
jgi:DNA-binding GntR family transcriptional regulator